MCTLFIRENYKKFNIQRVLPNKKYFRKDLRFTVDNPEDLIICKNIYKNIKKEFKLDEAIKFLDKNPKLKKLIAPYCDKGYSTMYRWGNNYIMNKNIKLWNSAKKIVGGNGLFSKRPENFLPNYWPVYFKKQRVVSFGI